MRRLFVLLVMVAIGAAALVARPATPSGAATPEAGGSEQTQAEATTSCPSGVSPALDPSWAINASVLFRTVFLPEDGDVTRLNRLEEVTETDETGTETTAIIRVKREFHLARICLGGDGRLNAQPAQTDPAWSGLYTFTVEEGTLEFQFAAADADDVYLVKTLDPDGDVLIDLTAATTVSLVAGEAIMFEDVDVDVVNPAPDATATFLVQQLSDVPGPGCVTKCF